jgi:hypothetical protein
MVRDVDGPGWTRPQPRVIRVGVWPVFPDDTYWVSSTQAWFRVTEGAWSGRPGPRNEMRFRLGGSQQVRIADRPGPVHGRGRQISARRPGRSSGGAWGEEATGR